MLEENMAEFLPYHAHGKSLPHYSKSRYSEGEDWYVWWHENTLHGQKHTIQVKPDE